MKKFERKIQASQLAGLGVEGAGAKGDVVAKEVLLGKGATRQIKWLIGVDEVGRGPLAGPLAFCACAMPYHGSPEKTYKKFLSLHEKEIKTRGLPELWSHATGGLRDSKKLTPEHRQAWVHFFEKKEALHFQYTALSAQKIDSLGLSACIAKLVQKSLKNILKKIGCAPHECLVLLDGGLRAPKEFSMQQTTVKGDQKEMVISFASIHAKVTRDNHMNRLSKKSQYALYGFDTHKGYGTVAHRAVIERKGPSDVHRRSFIKKAESRFQA